MLPARAGICFASLGFRFHRWWFRWKTCWHSQNRRHNAFWQLLRDSERLKINFVITDTIRVHIGRKRRRGKLSIRLGLSPTVYRPPLWIDRWTQADTWYGLGGRPEATHRNTSTGLATCTSAKEIFTKIFKGRDWTKFWKPQFTTCTTSHC